MSASIPLPVSLPDGTSLIKPDEGRKGSAPFLPTPDFPDVALAIGTPPSDPNNPMNALLGNMCTCTTKGSSWAEEVAEAAGFSSSRRSILMRPFTPTTAENPVCSQCGKSKTPFGVTPQAPHPLATMVSSSVHSSKSASNILGRVLTKRKDSQDNGSGDKPMARNRSRTLSSALRPTPPPPVVTSNPVCVRCQKDIRETIAEADSKSYHPECLTCQICGTLLQDEVIPHNNDVACRNCYLMACGLVCNVCQQLIMSDYFTADGKHYHVGCRNCDVSVSLHVLCSGFVDGHLYTLAMQFAADW
jgi:LIM domain